MLKIPAMVSMRRTSAEQTADATPTQPEYPWGLCISLCNDELEKLGLADDTPEHGDMLHIHAMCKVTSVSSNDTGDGPNWRIELQITDMVGEDEDTENAEEDKETPAPERRRRLYAG